MIDPKLFKNPYRLGGFELMREDLVFTDHHGDSIDVWPNPYDWKGKKGIQEILNAKWRVPNFEELVMITDLLQLGVLELNYDLPDSPSSRRPELSGYWSDTHSGLNSNYYWVMEIERGEDLIYTKITFREAREGWNDYRIRLVRDL